MSNKEAAIKLFLDSLDNYIESRNKLAEVEASKYSWTKEEKVTAAKNTCLANRAALSNELGDLLDSAAEEAITAHTDYFSHHRDHLYDY